jgi:hypothetical protein
VISEFINTWKRERRIRKVLRGLARQRVAMTGLGNILVIELALQRTENVKADLQTCLMRGWVEVIHHDLPTGQLDEFLGSDGNIQFTKSETHYRLTEGGWAARNRAHAWALANTVIAVIAVGVAVLLADSAA